MVPRRQAAELPLRPAERHQLSCSTRGAVRGSTAQPRLPGAWSGIGGPTARGILAGFAGAPPSRLTRSMSARSGGEQVVRRGCPTWSPSTTAAGTAVALADRRRDRQGRAGSRPRAARLGGRLCGTGHAIAVTSDGAGEDAWYGGRGVRDRSGDGPERQPVSSDVQFGWVAGSPSGTTAAVIEAVCSDRVVVCGDLRLIDVASGRSRRSISATSTRRAPSGSARNGCSSSDAVGWCRSPSR